MHTTGADSRAASGAGALQGLVVAELGGREAVAVCGTLLAYLGATVIVVEPEGAPRPRDTCRAQHVAGKLSLGFDPGRVADRALLARLVAASDVVVTASDVDTTELQVRDPNPRNIVCDITATGGDAGHGRGWSETQLQALTGIMHTTGEADGPPVAIGVPVIGYSAGTYAAAAVLAALRVRRRDGYGQRVEVAMLDAAFVSLNAYLAGVLTGGAGDRTRMGNRHPTIAPWNQYRTADGWVLICAGNQGQWERLCALMNRAELAAAYPTQKARGQAVDDIDAAIEAWTATLRTTDCVDRLASVGVAAGPIASIDRHPREANLDHRGMIRTLRDPVAAENIFVPGSPLALRDSPPLQPGSIPARDADRAAVERLARRASAGQAARAGLALARPLEGIRVVEVGQYTTAPMCARHLAYLGADVIKIEKPGGDESRTYEPVFGQRSEMFCMNNADKRGMVLDLQSPADLDVLKALLRTADVLVENNKPGTLARFGLDEAALVAINPRLVHCAISGFGADSLYADRPGFDTVIQAMSGFMAALRPDGLPMKSGISTADLLGAQMGIVAILAALEQRDRGGRGQFIDLSMQDVSCWLTSAVWNVDLAAVRRPAVVRCADGYLVVDDGRAALDAQLERAGLSRDGLTRSSRQQAVELLDGLGLAAASVCSIQEAAQLPLISSRNIWFTLPAEGRDWPILASPLGLRLTPPKVSRHAPGLNQDGPDILRELGLAGGAARL